VQEILLNPFKYPKEKRKERMRKKIRKKLKGIREKSKEI